jgi:hypothetical protein
MKKLILAATCSAALALSPTVPAQQPAAGAAPDAAALAKIRDRVRTDRKALVAQNLALGEAEAKAFWPAYDKCQASLNAAHAKVNRAILDYVAAGEKLTDANAKRIMGEALAGEAEEARARKACFEAVSKALPGVKAARYLQIEAKIAALHRWDAAVAIPLAQ